MASNYSIHMVSLALNYSIQMVSLASIRSILFASLATDQWRDRMLGVGANDANGMLRVEADDTIWMLWFKANDTIWMLQFEANDISRVLYITKLISFLLHSPKWIAFSNFQMYSCDQDKNTYLLSMICVYVTGSL